MVEAENNPPCVELSESLLAAMEGLLSTGMLEGLFAHESELMVNVSRSESAEAPFSFRVDDCHGRPQIHVRCGVFNPYHVSPDLQIKLKDRISLLITDILARTILMKDPEQTLTKLFQDELAMDRSINFTSSFVALGNVLGNSPKSDILAWNEPEARDYALLRSEAWDSAYQSETSGLSGSEVASEPTFGKGEPPAELVAVGQSQHSQVKTVSLIRKALWDRATWTGTLFAMSPDNSWPPVLAFLFRDPETSGQIFDNWNRELGSNDEEERLRVTLIRGISKRNPNAYRVVVGTNPTQAFSDRTVKYVFMPYRVLTMEPPSDHNLTRFLSSYDSFGRYLLTYAFQHSGSSEPELAWENCIAKRELHVREAWEIGRHDVDSAGILKDDDPIIPSGAQDAPVLDLL
jgi:hypothetical protein